MRPSTSSLTSALRFALVGAAVVALVALRTASRIAAARRAGRAWRPLDHQVVIPGDEPVLRLVVVGDSAVAGHGLSDAAQALPYQVGARLRRRTGRAVAVDGYARSGATTADVADEQVADVAGATVIVVGVGVNDALTPRRRVDEVGEDTTRLLTGIRAHAPDADLALLTCPDLSSAPGLPRVLSSVVGWRCRRVAAAQTQAAARAGVGVVSVAGALSSDVFGEDGLHPSPTAIEHLADRTAAVLAEPDARSEDIATGPFSPPAATSPLAVQPPAAASPARRP